MSNKPNPCTSTWAAGDYKPKPCANQLGTFFKDICDGMVDKERKGFTVCEGCVDSYSVSFVNREKSQQ